MPIDCSDRHEFSRPPRYVAAERASRWLVPGVAVALLAAGGAASAARRASPFHVLTPALQRFEALANEKRPRDLPRLADPETAPVLRTIWAGAEPDYDFIPDPTAEAMITTTIEGYEFGVLNTYLAFPAKPTVLADHSASPPSPAESDHLATLFGPELAQSMAASIAAIAHVSATFEHYRAKPPAPEAANLASFARAGRAPNLGMVALAQRFMAAPAFGPDNVARVAAAFAAHGARFAVVLSQADRAQVASSFTAIAQKLPDGPARRDLGRFSDELHAAPCGPLCAVP